MVDFLCIGCLEARIGQTLAREDFTDARLNRLPGSNSRHARATWRRCGMTGEPWLDRKKLADHYSCSVRSIELALAEGMPHAVVFGRVKFQVSDVEPWLRSTAIWTAG